MDNLAVHKNKNVIDRMNEVSFGWAWTPRYSPMFNGIEEVWSMRKRYIKEKRLSKILNNEEVNLKDLLS